MDRQGLVHNHVVCIIIITVIIIIYILIFHMDIHWLQSFGVLFQQNFVILSKYNMWAAVYFTGDSWIIINYNDADIDRWVVEVISAFTIQNAEHLNFDARTSSHIACRIDDNLCKMNSVVENAVEYDVILAIRNMIVSVKCLVICISMDSRFDRCFINYIYDFFSSVLWRRISNHEIWFSSIECVYYYIRNALDK